MMIPSFAVSFRESMFHDMHHVSKIAEITRPDYDRRSFPIVAGALAGGHRSDRRDRLGIGFAPVIRFGRQIFHIACH